MRLDTVDVDYEILDKMREKELTQNELGKCTSSLNSSSEMEPVIVIDGSVGESRRFTGGRK